MRFVSVIALLGLTGAAVAARQEKPTPATLEPAVLRAHVAKAKLQDAAAFADLALDTKKLDYNKSTYEVVWPVTVRKGVSADADRVRGLQRALRVRLSEVIDQFDGGLLAKGNELMKYDGVTVSPAGNGGNGNGNGGEWAWEWRLAWSVRWCCGVDYSSCCGGPRLKMTPYFVPSWVLLPTRGAAGAKMDKATSAQEILTRSEKSADTMPVAAKMARRPIDVTGLKSGDAETFYHRGLSAYKAGDYGPALDSFEAATKLAGLADARHWSYRALAAYHLGQRAEAESARAKAADARRGDGAGEAALALALERVQGPARAWLREPASAAPSAEGLTRK